MKVIINYDQPKKLVKIFDTSNFECYFATINSLFLTIDTIEDVYCNNNVLSFNVYEIKNKKIEIKQKVDIPNIENNRKYENGCFLYRYVDIKTKNILYIGKTKTLEQRLYAHSMSDLSNINSYYIEILFCNKNEVDLLEIYCIGLYKPLLNKDCINVDITNFAYKNKLNWMLYKSDIEYNSDKKNSSGNKKGCVLTKELYKKIIDVMAFGYTYNNIQHKPNISNAFALSIIANTGLKFSEIKKLSFNNFEITNNELYLNYNSNLYLIDDIGHALFNLMYDNRINKDKKIINISERGLQLSLNLLAQFLGIDNLVPMSFKKYYQLFR